MENGTVPDKSRKEISAKRPTNGVSLRNKVFVERNSLLDEYMKTEQGLLVFRIVLFIVFGLIVHTAAYDYFYKGRINLGQRLILLNFVNLHTFFLDWVILFISNFFVYYAFKYWATVRASLAPKSKSVKIWDYFWLALTILYYPAYLYLLTWTCIKQGMTIVLLIAMFCEGLRMLMKQHAFIRSNVPRALNYKSHTENGLPYPSLSHWMYFLWAPTAVYRDSYPRTKSVCWSYIGFKAVQFLVAIVLLSVVIERYFIHNFQDYGSKPYTWSDIIVRIIENAGGGILIMVTVFYMGFYVWLCAFAELCRFADRQFYQDWWTCTDYENYHRTWNIVIYDWLYAYVYTDFYNVILPGNKFAAKYAVFFISAVFHEYVLGFAFGFFMPIMFILFVIFGSFVSFQKTRFKMLNNAVFLYTLGLGGSINASFYAMEYYARLNCPIDERTLSSYFIPRLFSCSGA